MHSPSRGETLRVMRKWLETSPPSILPNRMKSFGTLLRGQYCLSRSRDLIARDL